ncbi:major tail protein [Mycobacterium phage LilSpotty]|uniref:Major tail protein n=1 Tax=Mycobacterium phage LilSpotty TaxID=2588512 RepID=A0A4Y6EWE3_9CAUD|nr:major tail protein [Mycobacterium phage LilSpotty]QDF19744.1 major tail protein [Mycobacterium phage LilSpotty]
MGDVKNVYAAEPTAAGCIFAAPLGTAGPAMPNPFAALDAAFVDLGDVGEDGFNEVTERNIDRKRNFGGRVVKVLQTEYGKRIELVFLESLSANVLKAIHGDSNVTVVAANSSHGEIVETRKNASRLPHMSWVIDTIDSSLGTSGNPARFRDYIPDGQIVETGDVKKVHTDTIEYPVTIEAFEDENGEHMYSWSDNGQKVTPAPSLRSNTTAYEVGDYVSLSGGAELKCTVAGTSGSSAPTAPGVGNQVIDGTVVWLQVG